MASLSIAAVTNLCAGFKMFDYRAWFRRADHFINGLSRLPGELKIKGTVAPPLASGEVDELAKASRLPIPRSLRDLWTTATSHCGLNYHWSRIPTELQHQVEVASSSRFQNYLWGGPHFLSAAEIVAITHDLPHWANAMRFEAPKDARIWENSLGLISVGNGDLVGLYVRDDTTDPPVVYMSHDEPGTSDILAENLAAFLTDWEQLRYLGIDFVMTFCDPESGRLDLDRYHSEIQSVSALLQGVVQPNATRGSLIRSEEEWLTSRNPVRMFLWMDQEAKRNQRKEQLFSCACCRRNWDIFDEFEKDAISKIEHAAWSRRDHSSLKELSRSLSNRLSSLSDEKLAHLPSNEVNDRECARRIASDAVLWGSWTTTISVTSMLDEPDAASVKAAHADLVRHIYGNPFRHQPLRFIDDPKISQLALELASGMPVATMLSESLQELGLAELAEHFQETYHPPGCWALDWLVGFGDNNVAK